MFQKTVSFQYASGLPGELAADGPLRATTFRLMSNPDQPNAAIGFGLAFTYANAVSEVSNPNTIASVPVAMPGALTASPGAFAGLLVNPKEHALFGDTTGPLAASFQLPDGSWGSLARMGTFFAMVKAADAAAGTYGNALFFEAATGALVAGADPETPPAGTTLIPGAKLLSPIGAAANGALARVELTQ